MLIVLVDFIFRSGIGRYKFLKVDCHMAQYLEMEGQERQKCYKSIVPAQTVVVLPKMACSLFKIKNKSALDSAKRTSNKLSLCVC